MSKYKEIKGFKVQTLASDTVASQIDTGAWASAASMNTARISSSGTGSASSNYIIAGGYYLPPTADRSVTEQYNGTAWTEVADCPQDLTYGNGLGSGTSSLLCSYSQPGPVPGGYGPTTATHKWNGSSWSTVNSMNTFRQNAGTAGTTTAGLVFGGSAPSANANTESWDGTNWTETSDLNTAKTDIGGGCGVQTAALSASGSPATTEQWNGSSWTEVTEINTPRQNSGKAGLYTSALCISGQNPSTYLANVEAWDGTAWTEVSDVATARGYVGGMSPTGSAGSSDAIIAGGSGASLSAATEVWTTSSSFTKINLGQVYYNSGSNAFKVTEQPVSGGTWASAANLNTAGTNAAGATAGTQTAALIFAGDRPSRVTATEKYDGTSWTTVNAMSTGRNNLGGAGITTSALGFGGGTPSYTNATEEYDGTNWTSGGNLNTTRQTTGAGASNSSALAVGGYDPSAVTDAVEQYNGTAWTEIAEINTARYIINNTGTVTAMLGAGGQPHNASVESWDGTSWTETTDLGTAKSGGYNSGTQGATLYSGGNASPGNIANVEAWDGSSWTEIADISSSRNVGGNCGAGTASAAIIYAGTGPGNLTEEFTASVTNKTITVS